MITVVRTFTIKGGDIWEAIPALEEMNSYVRENFDGVVHIERNISGSGRNVHWIGEHESLAAYESRLKKVVADEKFIKMYDEFAKTYVEEVNVLLLDRVS